MIRNPWEHAEDAADDPDRDRWAPVLDQAEFELSHRELSQAEAMGKAMDAMLRKIQEREDEALGAALAARFDTRGRP